MNMQVDNDFTGQAAENIHNEGAVYIGAVAQELAESEKQNRFYQSTGIWCPRDARPELEGLLEAGFVTPDLRVGWKANSLQWDARNRQVKPVAPVAELVAGTGMLLTMLFFLVFDALPHLIATPGLHGLAAFAAGAVLYGGIGWAVYRFAVRPAMVALRVRRRRGK